MINLFDLLLAKKAAGGGGKPVELQDKTFTENGTYKADEGYDGFGNVTVDVEKEIVVSDEELYNTLKGVVEGLIKKIIIPSGITKIADYKFYKTVSLSEIEIPEGVTSIGSYAFAQTNIKTLTIPSTVTTIKNFIVESCAYIETVTFKGKPTSLTANVLSKGVDIVNVPWSEGEVANAPWGATNATINYNYTEE